jgi:hypothetical protein
MPGYGYGISQVLTSTKSAATGGGGPFEYTAIDNNFSMEFDAASSEYIDAGQISAMDGTADYTISLWFKPVGSSGLGRIVSTQSTIRSPGPDIYYSRTSGVLSARVGWSSGSTGYAFNSSLERGLANDVWHHLVIVVDIAGLNYTAYVNNGTGVVVNRTGYSMTGTFEDLKIGSYGTGATSFWDGYIDEVAIWNTKLSESTIEAIYNTTNDNPGKVADLSETPEGVPVAWYRMGD